MSKDALHLLFLTPTHNEAEAMVSALRNIGKATRAHFIESLDDLTAQLEAKSWDLLITHPSVNSIKATDIFSLVRKLNKDIPIILLCSEPSPRLIESSLKLGASAVLNHKEQGIILLTIEQQLQHLRVRRQLRQLEVNQRDTEKRCQQLLENSRDAIAYIHDGMHVYANAAYLELFGYQDSDELAGIPILDMIERSAQAEFKALLKQLQHHQGRPLSLESRGVNIKQQSFAMRLQFASAVYAAEPCSQVRILLENSSSALEARLEEMSQLDQLTGLYNKAYFISELEEAAGQVVRGNQSGALFYINIDNFGALKSQYGLQHADTLIIEVAKKLQASLPDTGVLARTGEDIFCFFCLKVSIQTLEQHAENIRQSIEHMLIAVGDKTAKLTVSIGLSVISEANSRAQDILEQAHKASVLAHKENDNQGNAVHLFSLDEEQTQPNHNHIEQDFLAAIRNNQLQLMFQPLLNIHGGSTEHYEALLRIKQPNGEMQSAGGFLNSDQVNPRLKQKIDRWVIIQASKILDKHLHGGHQTKVFINLSAASIVDESLPGWINVALNTSGLPRGSIIFQFPEDDAIRSLKQAQNLTKALQQKGIAAALSRFGCALKPMQTLEHLDIKYVKVDGSFSQDLQNPESYEQLKKLLAALHEQGKITIIPLVENAASMASLWQTGAHFLQGYGVQAPQAAMTFNFGSDDDF